VHVEAFVKVSYSVMLILIWNRIYMVFINEWDNYNLYYLIKWSTWYIWRKT